MPITIIDPVSDGRWDRFIESHPHGTIFHHSAWSRVLRRIYKCEPTYYVEENDNGEILAGIPFFRIRRQFSGKRLVCLPFSEYGHPLGYSTDSIFRIMAAAEKEVLRKNVSCLEIRGWDPLINPAEAGLGVSSEFYGHVIDLPMDPEKLRSTIDKGSHLKRNLRLAEKSNLIIREACGKNDLRQFHKLTVETRRRLGLLPWTYRFIEEIFQHVVRTGHGRLLLAEFEGKITAGNLYFMHQDRALLKISASRREYSALRPNYLLTWKAIELFCKEKYRLYDFGITDLNNAGLRAFKRQWSSEERTVRYYAYPADIGQNSIRRHHLAFGVYQTLNKRLPDFVLCAAARILQKRLC